MSWRQNPSRVAWLILTTSFLTCCLLAVVVPLLTRSYVLHATRVKTAFIAATQGTVQLHVRGASDRTAVTERRLAPEGSEIITDASAKGLLTVSTDEAGERVLSTVQLWGDTEITLSHIRTPRFEISADPHRTDITLKRGRLFLASQRTDQRDVVIYLTTPHSQIILDPGTFDVTVLNNETQLRIRSGEAHIIAGGRQVNAGAGQRVTIAADSAPSLPVPDTVNLILNGTFERSLEPLWSQFATVKAGYEPGKVALVTEGRRTAIRFTRRTEDGVPNSVGVMQTVDRDVEGYDSLAMRLDVKLLYQSVPGGGEKATEYPVMVDLFYTDIYGKDLHWYQGFYYFDPPAGSPYLEPTGERTPFGLWYTYESPNLFELLKETRPARINSVSIYAMGHDYESLVSDVALTVR